MQRAWHIVGTWVQSDGAAVEIGGSVNRLYDLQQRDVGWRQRQCVAAGRTPGRSQQPGSNEVLENLSGERAGQVLCFCDLDQ
jgi:hypothetical protein